mgnify:FL=1
MTRTLFDDMDIPYHEWFGNVAGGWIYKHFRNCGMGPFSADTDIKKGKYIFRVSDHTTFYIFVDEAYESLVITYTWNNGKEAECNSLYLTKQELSFGKDHCDELMWQLTKPSGDVYKWEYRKEE